MNILPPSDSGTLPIWTIFFDDGTSFDSTDGPWSEVADLVDCDGTKVYQTRQTVAQVLLRHPLYPDQVLRLVAPASRPVPFFAFQRHAALLTADAEQHGASHWLYSCYGYAVPAYRMIVLFSPNGTVTQTQPRTTSFEL